MNQLPEWRPMLGQPQPTIVQPAAVELYADRSPAAVGERRVVGYENYGGMLVPVYEVRQELARPEPRDLTPQPLIDPLAQRLLAGGVGGGALAAGVGYGIGQAVGALAAGFPVLALFAIAALIASRATGRGGNVTHIEQTVHNHNRWMGKSTTNL